MIVEVHDAEALSGPERFVRRVLREGGVNLPRIGGLALFEVTVPRRRRFRGSEVDLLVWTPHRCIVVQIYGLASVQHGELDIRSNGRWHVGARPADLELPKSAANPLGPARRHTLDVQALFERHGLPQQLQTLVVLVPKTSSRITGHTPDFGNDTGVVLASSRQSEPLNRYFHRRVEGTPSWNVDDIVRACTILGRADDLPERAELTAQGFADTDSTPVPVPTAESEVDHAAAAGRRPPGESAASSEVTAAGASSTVDEPEPVVPADRSSTGGRLLSSSDAEDGVGAVPVGSMGTEALRSTHARASASAARGARVVTSVDVVSAVGGSSSAVLSADAAQGPGAASSDDAMSAAGCSSVTDASSATGRSKPVRTPRPAAHVPGAATRASAAGARPAVSRNDSGQPRPKRVPTAGVSVIIVVFVVLVFGACAVGTRFDVGDYAAMCASPRTFAEAADYTENGPSPVAVVGALDGVTGYDGSARWHPDEASSVQLVACLSQVRTGELVGTCRYAPGRGQPVGRTLNLFRAVYRVTVYEAATGSRLTTADIEGARFSDDPAAPAATETDSCRAAATVADEENLPGRRYSRVSRTQIHQVLDPVVQHRHRPERQE